jgi:hypothetical protein
MAQSSILGAYTNARAELQLLVGVEENGVVVLAHNDTSAVVTVGAKGKVLTLSDVEGIYNGVDSIRWSNGETWRRLQVSSEQAQVLLRRPYVPLTIVMLTLLRAMVTRASAVVLAVVLRCCVK